MSSKNSAGRRVVPELLGHRPDFQRLQERGLLVPAQGQKVLVVQGLAGLGDARQPLAVLGLIALVRTDQLHDR